MARNEEVSSRRGVGGVGDLEREPDGGQV
jgi:hypothetical protein